MSVKQDRTRARTPEDLERKYNLGKLAEDVEALKNAVENGKEDTEEVLPIEKGGTGATTAAAARSSLEITPENIGARPDTWMPTAAQVGARPNTWMPSASDVGAVPTSRKVNNKALSSDITLSASDVGARASNWMPTASEVGARPNTWTPSASDVGAMAARPVQVEFAGASGHGGYIDFHHGKSTADYTSRIIEASSGTLDVNGVSMSGGDIGAKNINLRGVDAPTINFASSAATISMAGTSNQLHFKSKGNMLFYPASANGTYFALLGNSMYHSTDNAVSCGASTKRWSTVYAGTGTINTSDRNEKENIRDIDEKYIRLFEKLRPVTYEFVGGNHDRIHIGYISQEVKEAMDEVGLTDLEFAGYCRDKKTEDMLDENGVLVGQKDVLDENGEPTYRYALRYAEFIALNTKMIQLQQKKIEDLEKKLQKLEAKVEGR